jgi:hypothetical protein
MAKFSKVVLGTRAEKEVKIPAVDGGEESYTALVRPLDGLEEEEVLVRARSRAIEKGLTEPRLGEPIYDMALMVETIAVGVLDIESPKDARQPFFDEGAEQVRQAYGREAISYIYQLQQTWQDEVSPTLLKLDSKATVEAMITIGGPNEVEARRFLEQCRPGLLLSLARSMGMLLYDSLTPRSDFGKSSESSGPSTKTASKN